MWKEDNKSGYFELLLIVNIPVIGGMSSPQPQTHLVYSLSLSSKWWPHAGCQAQALGGIFPSLSPFPPLPLSLPLPPSLSLSFSLPVIFSLSRLHTTLVFSVVYIPASFLAGLPSLSFALLMACSKQQSNLSKTQVEMP